MSKQVCLVLGGNGFIGSHIVDRLVVSDDLDVRVIDSFSKPVQFLRPDRVTTYKGSAFDAAILKKAVKGVDYVVYAVGASNPFIADLNPYIDLENTNKIIQIFQQCAESGVKKVAFISSGGAVYGKIAEVKVASEDDMPMPVSPYGICKLATEHYLEYFKRKYGMNYIVYRLTNPYGPRQPFSKEHGVIPSFLHAILEGDAITVFGDGTSSRDYIYIDDAAESIANSLTKENKQAVYNLGSGKQTTLNDIVSALEDILGKKATVKYVDAPPTTLHKTCVDISRLSNEFGLARHTTFREGLKVTLQAQKHLDLPQISR